MSFPIPELEFLRSGYFVVKLFSSRHYVYCFRFEMDMFWSLWLGRQYKKLLTDSQTPIRWRSDYIIGFIAPAIGPNKSKKLTRLTAPVHNIRGKVWMKNNIMASQTDSYRLWIPCTLFFIQTLPRILCASAISRVNFFDLFGPIAGAINRIM